MPCKKYCGNCPLALRPPENVLPLHEKLLRIYLPRTDSGSKKAWQILINITCLTTLISGTLFYMSKIERIPLRKSGGFSRLAVFFCKHSQPTRVRVQLP